MGNSGWNPSKLEEFWRTVNQSSANGTSANLTLSALPYLFDSVIWKPLDFEGYIKVFACSIIIIGGLLGNLGVLLTIVLTKSLWTTMNFCMVNLAVADAMICVFCMVPYAINVMTKDVYIWGNFLCKFHPFTQMACLICSVLTLSSMSCSRFMSVIFPIHARTRSFRISVLISVIWIISILLSVPLLILKTHVRIKWKDFDETKCTENWPAGIYYSKSSGITVQFSSLRVVYYLIISTMLYFVPVVIMIVSNSLVLCRLWTSKIPGEPVSNNETIHARTKRKWTIMVLIMLVVFLICWTPMQVKVFYGLYGPRRLSMPRWYSRFKWFAFYMAYANSFMNPIIYGGFNEPFRRKFILLLHCYAQRERFRESVRSSFTYTTGILSSVSTRLSRTLSATNKSSCNKRVVECEMCQTAPNLSISWKRGASESNGQQTVEIV